jgi:hypothetical protein
MKECPYWYRHRGPFKALYKFLKERLAVLSAASRQEIISCVNALAVERDNEAFASKLAEAYVQGEALRQDEKDNVNKVLRCLQQVQELRLELTSKSVPLGQTGSAEARLTCLISDLTGAVEELRVVVQMPYSILVNDVGFEASTLKEFVSEIDAVLHEATSASGGSLESKVLGAIKTCKSWISKSPDPSADEKQFMLFMKKSGGKLNSAKSDLQGFMNALEAASKASGKKALSGESAKQAAEAAELIDESMVLITLQTLIALLRVPQTRNKQAQEHTWLRDTCKGIDHAMIQFEVVNKYLQEADEILGTSYSKIVEKPQVEGVQEVGEEDELAEQLGALIDEDDVGLHQAAKPDSRMKRKQDLLDFGKGFFCFQWSRKDLQEQ